MSFETYDLIADRSADNFSGIKTRLYRVPIAWIDADNFPQTEWEYQQDQTTPAPVAGDTVKLRGDIVLLNGNTGEGHWQKFDIEINSGNHMFEQVGKYGSAELITGIGFKILGTEEVQVEFAANSVKPIWAYLVESRNGKYVLCGKPGLPAYCETLTADSGLQAGDENASTYAIKAQHKPLFYSGAIDLTPTA